MATQVKTTLQDINHHNGKTVLATKSLSSEQQQLLKSYLQSLSTNNLVENQRKSTALKNVLEQNENQKRNISDLTAKNDELKKSVEQLENKKKTLTNAITEKNQSLSTTEKAGLVVTTGATIVVTTGLTFGLAPIAIGVATIVGGTSTVLAKSAHSKLGINYQGVQAESKQNEINHYDEDFSISIHTSDYTFTQALLVEAIMQKENLRKEALDHLLNELTSKSNTMTTLAKESASLNEKQELLKKEIEELEKVNNQKSLWNVASDGVSFVLDKFKKGTDPVTGNNSSQPQK